MRPPSMDGDLRRILVRVPEKFLREFDRETRGLYASRNEAIRAGMIMVLEALKRREVLEERHASYSKGIMKMREKSVHSLGSID